MAVHIIAGLISLLFPQVFIEGKFHLMTGQQWSDFMASNPHVSSYIRILASAEGLFVFVSGTATLLIVLFAYRKKEKWSWYVILMLTTIGHAGSIIENLSVGDMTIVIVDVIMIVIVYFALAITATSILKREG
jgi:hypothetical protein